MNHQPIHYSLWEGNESLSSTHAQEEQIKLHLLKGVSKNFWPYFKTSVCVCVCENVCVERERERAEHRRRPSMSDFIYPKCSNYFSVSHLLLHMSKSCIHPSPGNENFSISYSPPVKKFGTVLCQEISSKPITAH